MTRAQSSLTRSRFGARRVCSPPGRGRGGNAYRGSRISLYMLGFPGHTSSIRFGRMRLPLKRQISRRSPVLFVLALVLSAAAAYAASPAAQPTLEGVLGLMDKAAQDFHSLSADVEHVKYTDVVKDTSVETGHFHVRRDAKMRIEILKPDERTILRTGDQLYVYTPKINRVEEYDLGKNRQLVDQYVLLGFGTKVDNIRKNYDIALKGEEELDQKKTVVLELTPKSETMRRQISKLQMWIDEASWLPLQQKFFETDSGDYFLFHYTNLMKNLKLDDVKFKPDWPKGVQKIKPRG
jgi:outer membrane lipoprotein-sorting protein